MSGAATAGSKAFPSGAAQHQGLRAGVISRLAATVIDVACVAALVAIAYLGFAGFRFLRNAPAFTWPHPSFGEVLVLGGAVAVFLLTTGWASTGRTSGMRIMGLRIIGRSGGRVGPVVALLRALACIAFPLGIFWSALSTRNASVQDLLFGTSVIYDWHMHVPPARTDEDGRPDVGVRPDDAGPSRETDPQTA